MEITGQMPVRTKAYRTVGEFDIREGDPTVRRSPSATTWPRSSSRRRSRSLNLATSQFDDTGNFSFGVEEHTEFPSRSTTRASVSTGWT